MREKSIVEGFHTFVIDLNPNKFSLGFKYIYSTRLGYISEYRKDYSNNLFRKTKSARILRVYAGVDATRINVASSLARTTRVTALVMTR